MLVAWAASSAVQTRRPSAVNWYRCVFCTLRINPWARNSATSHFFAWADGTLVWGSNVLSRIGNVAMQWVTNLTLRSVPGGVDPLLTLQETTAQPSDHRLLRALDNGGSNELAYINGQGLLYADNFKTSSVANPNNVVAGKKTLAESGLSLITGDSMADAAQKVVKAVGK